MNRNFKDVPVLLPGTEVLSPMWGKGLVLPRTKWLPDWMTLVGFRSDPTDDGRMAVFTDYIMY
jgi:hypothetical protein